MEREGEASTEQSQARERTRVREESHPFCTQDQRSLPMYPMVPTASSCMGLRERRSSWL